MKQHDYEQRQQKREERAQRQHHQQISPELCCFTGVASAEYRFESTPTTPMCTSPISSRNVVNNGLSTCRFFWMRSAPLGGLGCLIRTEVWLEHALEVPQVWSQQAERKGG